MTRLALVITIVLLATLKIAAQQHQPITSAITVYQDFRPATVYLTSGRKTSIPLANIFLKNGALLYMSGDNIMEAEMSTLLRVEFEDRTYVRIDSMLCYQVDSIGNDALFCVKVIDINAYKQSVANSANITNLDLNDLMTTNMLQYTTVDIGDAQDIHFPVIPLYYYRINDKFVLVHERHLKRFFDKEDRRRMESVMNLPDFSWTNEKFLLKILEVIK